MSAVWKTQWQPAGASSWVTKEMLEDGKSCSCCEPMISLNRFKYFSPPSHAHILKCFFKKMATYFWNSSNCKPSAGQWQAGRIFTNTREDEGQPDSASITHLELWKIFHFTVHLLCVCCSRHCSLPTWGPRGSAAVVDGGDRRLAGAEVDWASNDGRCRWAVIACRRSRSLQSC